MSWTLVVVGHGRYDYLGRTLQALDASVGLGWFDRRIMSLDVEFAPENGPGGVSWEILTTGGGKGLSANVQQAWDALGPDEWCLHLEEDFVVHDAPLNRMAAVLQSHPLVAQMVLERQPINAAEVANGGLLGGDNIPTFTAHGGPRGPFWREQRHLFSFNPCVYHSSIATVGGTERVITDRLLADGRRFGFWGAQGDPPLVEHIGVAGGMGSHGWRP